MRILADTATTDRPLIFVLIRANEQFNIVPFDENLIGPALSGDMLTVLLPTASRISNISLDFFFS